MGILKKNFIIVIDLPFVVLDWLYLKIFKNIKPLNVITKTRIIRLVSSREKRKLRWFKHYQLKGLVSFYSDRTFWKASLVDENNNTIDIFIKLGGIDPKHFLINEVLSKLDLPTPKYYGSYYKRGNKFIVWQYQEGIVKPSFFDYTRDELMCAAKQIAKFNVVGRQASKYLGAKRLFWAQPIANDLKSLATGYEEFELRTRAIHKFSEFEKLMLSVLGGDQELFLNHNDYKASNVILTSEHDNCLITDLDSSSIGPLGVSLRCFANMPLQSRELVVNAYVEEIKRLGCNCSLNEIHQIMCIQQIFWSFHTGLQTNEFKRIHEGLDLFVNQFSSGDTELFLNGVGEVIMPVNNKSRGSYR